MLYEFIQHSGRHRRGDIVELDEKHSQTQERLKRGIIREPVKFNPVEETAMDKPVLETKKKRKQ